MSYLYELEEKERKIVNSFIIRHSKFLSRLWIFIVVKVIIYIYISHCTNINVSSTFTCIFSFVLFWIWMGFISIIDTRNDRLLQIQNKISVTKKILAEISDEEYGEAPEGLFTSSNKFFHDDLFNFISAIYMKRNDTNIFVRYTIASSLTLESGPVSIKSVVEDELFNF